METVVIKYETCFYDSDICDVNNHSGTYYGYGFGTTEMKQQTTFAGWDFNNIWQIEEGKNYPTLRKKQTPLELPVKLSIVKTITAKNGKYYHKFEIVPNVKNVYIRFMASINYIKEELEGIVFYDRPIIFETNDGNDIDWRIVARADNYNDELVATIDKIHKKRVLQY